MLDSLIPKLEVRFKEVYESPEWKSLAPSDRGQLMLVAEGLKPGAFIGGNHTTFLTIVNQMGLKAVLTTEPDDPYPVYQVAYPAKMDEYSSALLALGANANANDAYYLEGDFLGYPKCCTDEYCHIALNRDERRKYSPDEFIVNFDFEVSKLIDKGQTYPQEFDYCPPTFTPCSVSCTDSLQTLAKYKELLEEFDPEAAEAIRYFNWHENPMQRLHEDEFELMHKRAIARCLKYDVLE